MKLISLWGVILISILSACNNQQKPVPSVEKRDTTITAGNAYSPLFFDSSKLEQFIQHHVIDDRLARPFRSFYNARNYQYAWFFNDGPAEQVYNFLNLQNDYIAYSRDSSLYDPSLQQVFDTLETGGHVFPLNDSSRLNAELTLTNQFFRYAAQDFLGDSKLNISDLKWFIPRKKIDIVATLDSLISNKGEKIVSYAPVNPYYLHLKEKLLQYYDIEKDGGWPPINTDIKKLKKGDSAAVISRIKHQLFLTGDFREADTSGSFTDSLVAAVKHFQHRHGLTEDGIIAGNTLQQIRQSVQTRIRQMLLNLERMRWVPSEISTDYILVNIPEFRLHVFEKGKLKFSMKVVVGSGQNNTVIFRGDLKYVVFSPYWNVPPGILKKEILPGMQKDRNYLARHNMEINGYSGSLPNVREKPGPNNSLGRVKFLFPNNYNIYLHDTPAKSLFGESRRAFSHGCIRLSEPKKLAEFLLRDDSTWTAAKISAAMNSGKEKYVTLKETVPVFIGYFTAWVDSKGQLNFRDDVYGHDKRLAEKLFQ